MIFPSVWYRHTQTTLPVYLQSVVNVHQNYLQHFVYRWDSFICETVVCVIVCNRDHLQFPKVSDFTVYEFNLRLKTKKVLGLRNKIISEKLRPTGFFSCII